MAFKFFCQTPFFCVNLFLKQLISEPEIRKKSLTMLILRTHGPPWSKVTIQHQHVLSYILSNWADTLFRIVYYV